MRFQIVLILLLLIVPLSEAQEIYIIGTAHVFDIAEKVEQAIIEIDPDAVAVELDEERLNYLLRGAEEAGEIDEIEPEIGEVEKPEETELTKDMISALIVIATMQSAIAQTHGAYSGEDMLAGMVTASLL